MATDYFDSGTHSLTYLATLNAIARQTGDGDIDNAEAVALLRRLRACVLHGVPIVAVTDKDLLASIGAPPEKEKTDV